MKNAHIMKLSGLLALICFLFLPVAGCGPMTVTGFGLITDTDIGFLVKILVILSLLCAVAMVFLTQKTQIFFAAVGGLAALVLAYIIAKIKMKSGGDDFGMSDAVELKLGAYLAILGFVIGAVVAKMDRELMGEKPEEGKDEGRGTKDE